MGSKPDCVVLNSTTPFLIVFHNVLIVPQKVCIVFQKVCNGNHSTTDLINPFTANIKVH